MRDESQNHMLTSDIHTLRGDKRRYNNTTVFTKGRETTPQRHALEKE